jgi:hypothetical protein
LFNLLTKRRLDGLSTADARKAVYAIEAADRAYWLAWTQGLEDWVPLDDLEKKRKAEGKPGTEKGTGNLDRRLHARHQARFRVIMKRGQDCFRTFSSDVSKGGARLGRKAPSRFFGQPCEIFISSFDLRESIRLIGVPTPDENDAMRVCFTQVDADTIKRLSAWARSATAKKSG